MVKQIGIEYVCSGNSGRSPMAETIAKHYVKKFSLEGLINIFSSGTDVDMFKRDIYNYPVYALMYYINLGLKNGIFSDYVKQKAEKLITEQEEIIKETYKNPEIKKEIQHCINYLSLNEVSNRNRVLLELDLIPEGLFHKQTIIQNDINLILTMKKSNTEKVEQIYKSSKEGLLILPQLKITTICEYTGVGGEIEDPFAGTFEGYRKVRDQIVQFVQKSVLKASQDYSI